MTRIGDYTVTATCGSSMRSCTVTVTNDWIAVSGVPKPPIIGTVSGSTTDIYIEGIFDLDTWKYLTSSSGTYSWDSIGTGTYDAGDSFQTSKSTAWNAGTSVTGEVEFGLPWGGAKSKVSVTGSFGWETTLEHTLTTSGGESAYEYKATHSQGVCAVQLTHKKYWKDESGNPWVFKGTSTTSGGTDGVKYYHQGKWKWVKP